MATDIQQRTIDTWKAKRHNITETARLLKMDEDWVIYHLRDAGMIEPGPGRTGNRIVKEAVE